MWSRPNNFETLVHIILEQQVSLAAAPEALINCVIDCYFSRQKAFSVSREALPPGKKINQVYRPHCIFVSLKKGILLISFLLTFLNSVSLEQLFKLPNFITHYIEHHQQDNRISICDFIAMHYWGDDHNDNDEDKDMQLPFKKHVETLSFQIIVPAARIFIERQQLYVPQLVQSLASTDHLPDPSLRSLFRPPRI